MLLKQLTMAQRFTKVLHSCYWSAFTFVILASLCSSAPNDALVTSLPGFIGSLASNHYAGYITVDESHGKKLYYYFVESERSPSEDPLVLWLNGGPGCSSFDGFVYEHGPFNFEKLGRNMPKLHLNKYSWSKVSNVLYLDSPAGVGFSYSNNLSDYQIEDFQTASDAHTFLLKWFDLFPEFLPNRFFISGESYAGIYVPNLALKVVQGIESGTQPIINLEGYLIGNALTDINYDRNSFVPFAHGMGLIPDDLFNDVRKACKGNYSTFVDEECSSHLAKVHEAIDDLNRYDILEPCYHDEAVWDTAELRLPSSFRRLGETDKPSPIRKRIGKARPLVRDETVASWLGVLKERHLPCVDYDAATWWLNDASVREAINAVDESVSGKWQICSDNLNYTFDSGSMMPHHRTLTHKGYRALIYSGDHDMCIPYTGTQAWVRDMGYATVDAWRPWYSGGQVAGFTQGYDYNLTFLTIKGAGHTVPEYKPRESLDFYSRFLDNKPM